MDRLVLQEKLESLARCVRRIEQKRPPSLDALAVRLRGAVGFRNIAVHNYDRVDWAIVFAISTRHLDDFREFAAAVRLRD